jgi:hypothetical protein
MGNGLRLGGRTRESTKGRVRAKAASTGPDFSIVDANSEDSAGVVSIKA